VYRVWVEDWEEEMWKKNDCVCEAQWLAKYEGLVSCDPDTQKVNYICDQHMEFCRGRGQGWFLIGIWVDNPGPDEELEPYTLELACELIADTHRKMDRTIMGSKHVDMVFSGGTSPFSNKINQLFFYITSLCSMHSVTLFADMVPTSEKPTLTLPCRHPRRKFFAPCR
jgi:hypothetical protein